MCGLYSQTSPPGGKSRVWSQEQEVGDLWASGQAGKDQNTEPLNSLYPCVPRECAAGVGCRSAPGGLGRAGMLLQPEETGGAALQLRDVPLGSHCPQGSPGGCGVPQIQQEGRDIPRNTHTLVLGLVLLRWRHGKNFLINHLQSGTGTNRVEPLSHLILSYLI